MPATGGVAPAAPTTVEDDATPLAEAAEETAAPEAVAETISDDGTPLARTPESCYFPYLGVGRCSDRHLWLPGGSQSQE